MNIGLFCVRAAGDLGYSLEREGAVKRAEDEKYQRGEENTIKKEGTQKAAQV